MKTRTRASRVEHAPRLVRICVHAQVKADFTTGANGFSGVNPNSTTPALVPLQIDYVSGYRYR